MDSLTGTLSSHALSLLNAIPDKRLVRFRTGEVVFRQGDHPDYVYFIDLGTIKVSVLSNIGKEVVIALLGPGQFLGESALMDSPRRLAGATCLTNCRLWRIKATLVLRLINEDQLFSASFLQYLLARNRRYEEDIADHMVNCSEKRLARALLLLTHFGSSLAETKTVPAVSHEILAELVGTTRPRITFFMNRFRELGLIEYDRHILTVRKSLLKILLRQ